MAIKMEKHPTQQTPDYKSRNRRMEGRIQKIPQGRDYPISSMYWTHRHHPLISTQTRTTTMVCGTSHSIFSTTPIDRLHRPKTKETKFLHCKQYERTIWTCAFVKETSRETLVSASSSDNNKLLLGENRKVFCHISGIRIINIFFAIDNGTEKSRPYNLQK